MSEHKINVQNTSEHTNKTLFSVHAQVGQLSDVTPAAIKAQDGDTGIDEPMVYSITTGTVNNDLQHTYMTCILIQTINNNVS